MSNLNIQYQGKVTVKYEKNGKILKTYQVHNEGTEELFRFLCICLCNNLPQSGLSSNDNKFNCPEYIMLYNLQDGKILTQSILATTDCPKALNNTSFKVKVDCIESNNDYKTKFRFIIPTNSLIEEKANVIAIYSSKNRKTATQSGGAKPSAFVKLVDSNGDDMSILKSTISNAIIEWEMSFENPQVQENSGGNE